MKRLLIIIYIAIVALLFAGPNARFYPIPVNYKQVGEECGMHAIYACLNAFKMDVAIEEIVTDLKSELTPGAGLYPWTIMKFMKKYKVKSFFYWAGLKSNEKRIDWLKITLAKLGPVILLTKTHDNSLHWVTCLGYSGNVFYIYDSYLSVGKVGGYRDITVDKNGDRPGNMKVNENELIKLWKKGKAYGFSFLCIVVGEDDD